MQSVLHGVSPTRGRCAHKSGPCGAQRANADVESEAELFEGEDLAYSRGFGSVTASGILLSIDLSTYLSIYISPHLSVYIYTHIHTYVYACMHAYRHTYIRTYIHTYIVLEVIKTALVAGIAESSGEGCL